MTESECDRKLTWKEFVHLIWAYFLIPSLRSRSDRGLRCTKAAPFPVHAVLHFVSLGVNSRSFRCPDPETSRSHPQSWTLQ